MASVLPFRPRPPAPPASPPATFTTTDEAQCFTHAVEWMSAAECLGRGEG
jgi:hypothetical protein